MDKGNNEGKKFYTNEIVWGKIQGHPWWPGIITTQQQKDGVNLYRVDFLGNQPTYSLLTKHKIIKYEAFDTKKNKDHCTLELKKAMNQAHSLYKSLKKQNNINSCSYWNPVSIPQSCQLLLNPTSKNCGLKKQKEKMSKNNKQKSLNIVKPFIQKISTIQDITVPKKRGRKPKNVNNEVEYQQVQKLNKNVKKQQIYKLLEQYGLHQIPEPFPQKQMSKHQQSLVCRKIQKILKFSGFQPKRRYELALKLQHKLKSISDFTQLIQQLKKGSFGLEDIKNLQEENPNQTLSNTL